MTKTYDAIVVGARAAGSPTAMLLARKGYRVLVIDRATFPSDTMSTLMIHPTGVSRLARWGLLDRLIATGVPPVDTYRFELGPLTLAGQPRPIEGHAVGYAPRRTVLDKLLVDAAAEAGAEVREGFTVDELVIEDGTVVGIRGHGRDGTAVTERARVVIGSDGDHSVVAKVVDAPRYNERPVQMASYYAFWSGLAHDGAFAAYDRGARGWAIIPTHDDLHIVVVGWPYAEFAANKRDIEGNVMRALEMDPSVAERVRAATRESKFVGAAVTNFYRKPFGPGWALVGDAGYHKDPITAMGISDAFRDSELVTAAIDESFSGVRSYDEAMTSYQQTRDAASMPMYDFTLQLASFEPPPPEMQQLLGAVAGNPEATRDFISVQAGTMSVPDFFAPDNIGKYFASAGAGQEVPA